MSTSNVALCWGKILCKIFKMLKAAFGEHTMGKNDMFLGSLPNVKLMHPELKMPTVWVMYQ
jgi:hypothetical protein